jgi:drug/metabolite transporter (DMT)-like permease
LTRNGAFSSQQPNSVRVQSNWKHWLAVLQAFVVTVLWSSSFVIIKFGLQEIPPLIFAGLRYTIAAVILLLATLLLPKQRAAIKSLNRKWWGLLSLYGIIYYTITMGTQFIGLALLPAITVSFILNFTTILVVLLGFLFLHERPTPKQLLLIVVALVGTGFYFFPLDLPSAALFGILIITISLIANSFSAILGRAVNREGTIPPLLVTSISMTIGTIFLLVSGLLLDGLPVLTPLGLLIVLWLAIVNTALTFTLWNNAMRYLRALEITIINSTMMAQIAILALIFLGELPTLLDWIGIILVMIAAMLIQIFRRPVHHEAKNNQDPVLPDLKEKS